MPATAVTLPPPTDGPRLRNLRLLSESAPWGRAAVASGLADRGRGPPPPRTMKESVGPQGGSMPDMIRQVDYYYSMAPDKAGEGARLLSALRNAGVNLLAFSAFPSARKSQADFVPADGAAFVAAAKQAKIKLKGPKKCFLIEGDDRVGALYQTMTRLGDAKINVTAVDAVTSGMGRWAAILWVKQRDVKKAAQILGAT